MNKIKNRILSIVITCAMMVSLLAGMAPMEVRAEESACTVESASVSVAKTADNTYSL